MLAIPHHSGIITPSNQKGNEMEMLSLFIGALACLLIGLTALVI
jgi:hypothetical protein